MVSHRRYHVHGSGRKPLLRGPHRGRETWGNWAWGVNYSVILNGLSLSTTLGNETASIGIDANVTGIELTATEGTAVLDLIH